MGTKMYNKCDVTLQSYFYTQDFKLSEFEKTYLQNSLQTY